MRVFLAIDVPIRSIPHLSDFALIYVSHYHITLAFFGDISPAELVVIKEKLSIFRAEMFSVTTQSHLSCFARWDKLHSVHIPVEYSRQLNQLYLKLAYLFKGVFEFGKEFIPHITLARVKQEVSHETITALQAQRVEPVQFRVEKLVLYESKLLADGVSYNVLATYKLS